MGRRAQFLFWFVVIGMFLAGPFAVARMGAYMRYVGDDYCFMSEMKRGGFIDGQINSFQMIERFSGQRYSLTMLAFVTGLFGPKGFGAAVAMLLLLWLSGLFVAVYQLLRILGVERAREPSLALASTATFFILLTNADLFSAVYWISAYYSYFAPMVAIVWLSAAMLFALRAGRVTGWLLLLLFALAWLFGAFSEAGNIVQIGWFLLMGLTVWGVEGRRFWRRDYKLFVVTLVGTVLALATMMMSPYGMSFLFSTAPRSDIPNLISRVFRYSSDYFLHPGRGLTTPFLVEVVLFTAIGITLSRRFRSDVAWPRVVLIMTAIVLFGMLLVGAAFLPNYLVLDSSPSIRAQTPAQVIRQLAYVALAIAVGWAIGRAFASRKKAHSVILVAAPFAILVASLYPIRAYPYLVERERFMEKWALLWDQRDIQIREAARNDEPQVHVMELDHPIPWVAELGPDPNANYNVCAQEYYGIPVIIADLPGWNSFILP